MAAADWLRAHDWDVSVTPAKQLMAGYDRHVPDNVEDATPLSLFISGPRVGGSA